jgi:hypothetical protein
LIDQASAARAFFVVALAMRETVQPSSDSQGVSQD